MLDLNLPEKDIEILPGRKLAARVAGVYIADGDDFETRACEALELDFRGILADFHAGYTRRSGGREPWYPRGTEMRNERQITIIAPDEMAQAAALMGISGIRPEWVGANLLLEGVPRLSMLPPGTLLFFKGGVTLKVDAQNHPCRIAGQRIAERAGMSDPNAGALLFPKVARRLRGLVAWVEKPGRIEKGEAVSLRIPEQWIYRP